MKYFIIILLILIPFKHLNSGCNRLVPIEEQIRIKELRLEVLKSKIRVEIAELKYSQI